MVAAKSWFNVLDTAITGIAGITGIAEIAEIKARLDCREIALRTIGRAASRGSKSLLFHAPHREDKHPSFGVTYYGFKDFATGESGDAFDLLRLLYGLNTFAEAYHKALELLNSPIPHAAPRPLPRADATPPDQPPSAAWQRAALKAVHQAEAYLWSDRADARAVRAYLMTVRGLSEQTIRHFRLGFNPHWRQTDGQTDGHAQGTAAAPGARLAPGIVIPCFEGDQLWYVKVRCIVGDLAAALKRPNARIRSGESPKYVNLSGSRSGALFNANALSAGQPILLVEGEFDAMLAHQLCGAQVAAVTVGSASAGLLPPFRARLRAAPFALVGMDNDDAGRAGAARFRPHLPDTHLTLTLPAGKDITEFVQIHKGDLPALLAERVAAANDARAAKAAATAAAALGLPNGVPDTMRAAVNAFCYPAIAPTLELWYEAIYAGLIDPTAPLTADVLFEAGAKLARNVSLVTLRTGLKQGAGQFWRVLQTDRIPNKGKVAEGTEIHPICKTLQNPTRSPGRAGRTPTRYVLLHFEEQRTNLLRRAALRLLEQNFPPEDELIAPVRAGFLQALGYSSDGATRLAEALSGLYGSKVEEQPGLQARLDRMREALQKLKADLCKLTSTPLPAGWQFQNASQYIAVFARALVQAQPNVQRSRAQLARMLGCGTRIVGAVLKRAGVKNQREEVMRPIATPAEFDRVEAKYDRDMQGFPTAVLTQRSPDEPVYQVHLNGEAREFVVRELNAGAAVAVLYQQASRQVLVTETQPPPKRRRPAVRAAQPSGAPSGQAKRTPAKAPTACAVRRYYGAGFNPDWAGAWLLKLLSQCLHWVGEEPGQNLPPHVLAQALAAHAAEKAQLPEIRIGRCSVGVDAVMDAVLNPRSMIAEIAETAETAEEDVGRAGGWGGSPA